MNRVVISRQPVFAPPALRLFAERLSMRIDARTSAVCLGLGLLGLVLALAALRLGTMPVSFAQVLHTLSGEGQPAERLVLLEWRLPRVLGAALAGAGLGLAGALFQTLLRNPLGSPDILGFDAGAFLGLALAMLAGGSTVALTSATLSGGLVAGTLILLLSGGLHADRLRLILTGIAIGALFSALSEWLVFTAPLDTALTLANWKQGSLAGIDWVRLGTATTLFSLLLPLGLGCGRMMRALELGDDKALSLGQPAGNARLRLALTGLGLTATATLLAGPIGFVALISPQVARRMAGTAGLPLLTSMLVGVVFLLGADLAARTLFAPRSLPVGAVTACLGGFYFAVLLRSRFVRPGAPR
ncbi:MAG TPA: iron chelate uptake ABC transporter family permease subunit [Bosea sp. (in: a-proteobacteria)]|jgi:iron complex transport system permease protein|uniref:FecCD family ABC transporter permease n=1 Tax=Bosea sp. (in: a-proteobacteria) TaxID=1871050 RepID=UPI002E10AFDC|nr:iron chelate uptake ABC transporter family permease subunit [Bosea sp. (in: a-proteobacteria)]